MGTERRERQMGNADDRQVGGDHYIEMGVGPWDVISTWPLEQQIGFFRGTALKYLMRMGTKDDRGIEVGKAAHYLQKLLEVMGEEDGE
jgi:Protein of unknwon function (DUF3310)